MRLTYFVMLLLSFQAWAGPCGKEGSIEARIKDCNVTKGDFVLVVRDEKNNEIYKNLKNGLLWGDRISIDFNHYGSQKACTGESFGSELIKDLKWRLPTIREFEEGSRHGMKLHLPNMNHWFWTSTPVVKSRSKKRRRRRAQPAQAFLWDGIEEVSDAGDLKDGASVRCVAKE